MIALTDGHQLLADVTWGMLQLDYQRSPDVGVNNKIIEYPSVSNQAAGVAIPQILFTTDFGTDQFGLGVGVFPPNAAPAIAPYGLPVARPPPTPPAIISLTILRPPDRYCCRMTSRRCCQQSMPYSWSGR